jgi:GAF domain-containing protein
MKPTALTEIAARAGDARDREARAREIAAVVRAERRFRWVGLYDVGEGEVGIVAWAGGGPPSYPRFPTDRGLTSRAIASRSTVLVNDVAADAGYLEAFGDTRAELIVPVLRHAVVVGTVDVESDRVDGFSAADVVFVEECATAAASLWHAS